MCRSRRPPRGRGSATLRRAASARPRLICSSGRSCHGIASSARIGRHDQFGRQVFGREVARHLSRDVFGARRPAPPWSAPPRPSRRTGRCGRRGRAMRRAPAPGCGGARRPAQPAPPRISRQRSAPERAGGCRRGFSRAVIAHRRARCRSAHRLWKVRPSGAGMSRTGVQPDASGRLRNRPRAAPAQPSTRPATLRSARGRAPAGAPPRPTDRGPVR